MQDIRAQVRELGVINPNAIEDYNRLQERVTGLTLQREDLLKAKADLTRVIGELMNVMRETFQERFDRINENFQEIFQELFGGGRGKIRRIGVVGLAHAEYIDFFKLLCILKFHF